jgi:CheY-like chemotaxis protein
MWPKKRILLIDTNEERQSIMRMVLKTWGYAVEIAADAESAVVQQLEKPFELVIGRWPLRGIAAIEMLQQLKQAHPYGRNLVLSAKNEPPAAVRAEVDMTLILSQYTPAEQNNVLRQHCKNLCAIKRGPRKKLPSKIPPATLTTQRISA